MRTSDWIQIVFDFVLALAAWATCLTSYPLPLERRWIVLRLAAAAVVLFALGLLCVRFLSSRAGLVLHDFLTISLFLVPYWQTGQFFLQPNLKIQNRLMAFARLLIPAIAGTSGTNLTP